MTGVNSVWNAGPARRELRMKVVAWGRAAGESGGLCCDQLFGCKISCEESEAEMSNSCLCEGVAPAPAAGGTLRATY